MTWSRYISGTRGLSLIALAGLVVICLSTYQLLRIRLTSDRFGFHSGYVPTPAVQIYDGDRERCIRDCITGQEMESVKVLPVETRPLAPRTTQQTGEDSKARRSSFTSIFQNGTWAEFPRSGPGSMINVTQEAMKTLDSVIMRIKKSTGLSRIRMLDVPCGDMTWMSHFLAEREDIDYTGYDIVPEMIESHQKQFAGRGWKFEDRDVIVDGFKGITYDLVFSRMMLQHLYTEDALRFLNTVSQSGSRFLLTTTFPTLTSNSELQTTGYRYRHMNLEAPPFALVTPLCYSRDSPDANEIFYLGLWSLPLMRVESCTVAVKSVKPLLDGKTLFGCSGLAA